MAEDIAASTVLGMLNLPDATDSERGLALAKVAGKMTGIYDAEGNHILVRAEQIKHYLAKDGFSAEGPKAPESKSKSAPPTAFGAKKEN